MLVIGGVQAGVCGRNELERLLGEEPNGWLAGALNLIEHHLEIASGSAYGPDIFPR
ncbi:hypothetical protein [Tunturiibacter gelidiferens]|uniref:hypothetical protein n=1 Tax=Tunturiibacter gelidiferens TaxID=3069689 RepID=UPI003D9B780A